MCSKCVTQKLGAVHRYEVKRTKVLFTNSSHENYLWYFIESNFIFAKIASRVAVKAWIILKLRTAILSADQNVGVYYPLWDTVRFPEWNGVELGVFRL